MGTEEAAETEETEGTEGTTTDETGQGELPSPEESVRPDRERAEGSRDPPEETNPAEAVRSAVIGDLFEWFDTASEGDQETDEGDQETTGDDQETDDDDQQADEDDQQTPTTGPFAPPTREFLETSFFDLSYLEGRSEVERYWINEPFAYVSVLYHEARQTYYYHVTEPALDNFEQYVRADLVQTTRNRLMYRDIDERGRKRREVFEEEVDRIIEDHAATVDPGSIQKIRYYLIRDFVDFGRIDPLMRDGAIEDISCDGADIPVFIYHRRYRDLRTNITFGGERLNSLVVRLAQRAGKHLSISDPLVDASLPNGSRVQLTLGGDVASRGSNFTIRKFSDVPFTPVDLVTGNTFSLEEMAYLWLCIENNRSLVFAGGTGAGKTTSLNAVSFFIPPDSKVVSIEDTREIVLPHDNWVQSLTRDAVGGRGDIDTHTLLQTALRQRPEYLLVGEIRTDQRVALTFFQAISTGHTCYTTIHADSVEGALSRLQNPPLSVPTQMLSELDIVSIQKQVSVGDGRLRRNQTLAELHVDDSGAIHSHNIFSRDAKGDTHRRVGNSRVLDDVADLNGWDDEQLNEQLADRERVLAYLVEEGVTDYREVAAVIQTFQRNPGYINERIADSSLRPADLVGDQ